jgi:hypothetical protein
MKSVIALLLLASPIVAENRAMGPYIPVPRINVDPKSPEGTTDNPNLRCTAKIANGGKVVVEIKAKNGYAVDGVNLTISDDSGVVVSAVLAPILDGEWVSYCFTLRRVYLDRAVIDVYAPEQSGRICLKGLPIRTDNKHGEQAAP